MMTSDPRLARMILTYFNEDDFQRIEDHKTGDGVIGGKSCGFLLVEKMMEKLLPEYRDRWEAMSVLVCGDRDFLSGS